MTDLFTTLTVVIAAIALALTFFGTFNAISDYSSSRSYGQQDRPLPRVYPLWLRIVVAGAIILYLAVAYFGPFEDLLTRPHYVFGIELFGFLAYDAYLWLRRPFAEA